MTHFGLIIDFIYNLGKDKLYKIKQVVFNEDNYAVEQKDPAKETFDSAAVKRNRNSKRVNLGIDDFDSDQEHENSKVPKNKKAVFDYKEAINLIGSKSCTVSSVSRGKKSLEKVIVSENEYNMNDNWLINDLNKKPTGVSNKRKFKANSHEDLEHGHLDDDLSNLTFEENDEEKDTKSSDTDDLFIHQPRKNKKSNKTEKITSPISKKRYIHHHTDNQMDSDSLPESLPMEDLYDLEETQQITKKQINGNKILVQK